ncbi:MAG: dephospho-CoA kinase [Betaproteobacteria bacterium]|nr:dephospho-CoA kinase [Betaproteobacteria bacterium]
MSGKPRPYAVGLTGGIGCGKSTVAALFEGLGAGIVDTDAIAHELTGTGCAGTVRIEAEFGPAYIRPDGAVDRARLREHVFADDLALKRLEALLHPPIRDEVIRRLALLRAPYAVIVVPLLFETGAYHDLVDRTLVVDCTEAQQVERLETHRGLSPESIASIRAHQWTRAQRLAAADDVIDNSGDGHTLAQQVRRLHADYLTRAH